MFTKYGEAMTSSLDLYFDRKKCGKSEQLLVVSVYDPVMGTSKTLLPVDNPHPVRLNQSLEDLENEIWKQRKTRSLLALSSNLSHSKSQGYDCIELDSHAIEDDNS